MQWRGPNFDGSSEATNLPDTIEKDKAVWTTKIPGVGNGSPVVAGDRIFVSAPIRRAANCSASASPRPMGTSSGRKKSGSDSTRTTAMMRRPPRPSLMENSSTSISPPAISPLSMSRASRFGIAIFRKTSAISASSGSIPPARCCTRVNSTFKCLRREPRFVPPRPRSQHREGHLEDHPAHRRGRRNPRVLRHANSLRRPRPHRNRPRRRRLRHLPRCGNRKGTLARRRMEPHPYRPLAPRPLRNRRSQGQSRLRLRPQGRAGDGDRAAGGSGDVTATHFAWKSDGNASGITSDVCVPLFYKGNLFILNDSKKVMYCLDPKSGSVKWSGDLGGKSPFRAPATSGRWKNLLHERSRRRLGAGRRRVQDTEPYVVRGNPQPWNDRGDGWDGHHSIWGEALRIQEVKLSDRGRVEGGTANSCPVLPPRTGRAGFPHPALMVSFFLTHSWADT